MEERKVESFNINCLVALHGCVAYGGQNGCLIPFCFGPKHCPLMLTRKWASYIILFWNSQTYLNSYFFEFHGASSLETIKWYALVIYRGWQDKSCIMWSLACSHFKPTPPLSFPWCTTWIMQGGWFDHPPRSFAFPPSLKLILTLYYYLQFLFCLYSIELSFCFWLPTYHLKNQPFGFI